MLRGSSPPKTNPLLRYGSSNISQNLATEDSNGISWRGWAWKLGKVNKRWKMRYWGLWNSRILYYFGKENDYNKFLKGDTHRNMAKGFIDLTTVTSVDINTDGDKPIVKLSTPKRTWNISPNIEERVTKTEFPITPPKLFDK